MIRMTLYPVIVILFAGILLENDTPNVTDILFERVQLNNMEEMVMENPDRRDGQNDFDFSIGVWRTELLRLVNPLSGSDEWAEYEGTSTVREVWDGRANLIELDVEGPAGRIEGLSLRLYNPDSRQWSLNYATSRSGVMTPPVIGEFRSGKGEFFGQIMLNGRVIFVKFIMTKIEPNMWRYEQFFSDDGGETWEVNWIAIDTLLSDETDH